MLINITKIGRSLTVKGFITGFLILLMMIPAAMLQDLVKERKDRQEEVIAEVSSKWANQQVLSGPYLSVPYSQTIKTSEGKIATLEKTMIILPQTLEVLGDINPQFKSRGIYKVALYKTDIGMKGAFNLKEVEIAADEMVHWDKAHLCIGVSDTRGIEEQPVAGFLGKQIPFAAGVPGKWLAARGASLEADLSEHTQDDLLSFSIPLKLRGSESLQVIPVGKSTTVQIKSPWTSPSFTGKFLPEYTLGKDGFDANWQVLHFNRDFPQVWKNQEYDASDFAFGMSLLQPTDHYAKTTRSVKYAILLIGLTFGFFFLLEALQGHRVHPVQYILTGIALVVFYTLLLSIGEVLDFNLAYAIAALATTGLITSYGRHLFKSLKNALVLSGFLGSLYAFIFVLIQLEDRSLLAGSIGLFILVAIAMNISRKITWFEKETTSEVPTIES